MPCYAAVCNTDRATPLRQRSDVVCTAVLLVYTKLVVYCQFDGSMLG